MQELIKITEQLRKKVNQLKFAAPVVHVYNPIDYARAPMETYIKKYARKSAALLVGMNPGPFGMAQTGVPFGDVTMVTAYLGINEPVECPANPHPKRPVDGFECPRSEVSGTRLWGWAQQAFPDPNDFFDRFYVFNYCPLVFMGDTGKNITPDKLPAAEQRALFDICDAALSQTAACMESKLVIGVGAFAEKRCKAAIDSDAVTIGRVLHPSPASPVANRGWAPQAEKQLKALGAF